MGLVGLALNAKRTVVHELLPHLSGFGLVGETPLALVLEGFCTPLFGMVFPLPHEHMVSVTLPDLRENHGFLTDATDEFIPKHTLEIPRLSTMKIADERVDLGVGIKGLVFGFRCHTKVSNQVARPGFEPRPKESESSVLPLHYQAR